MKLKKKTMNKIHNEMVRRFSPYWDRKNQDIRQLQNAVVDLQKAVRELAAHQATQAVAEASKGDRGRHVAKPEVEIPPLTEVWEAHFYTYGGRSAATIRAERLAALKKLNIEHFVSGSAHNPGYVRVHLLTTVFPGKVEALREQVSRIMGAPVKVLWRKVQ